MKRFNPFGLLLILAFFSAQVLADATTTTTSVSTTAPAGTTVVTTPPTGAPAPTTVITDKDAMMAAIVSDVQAKISQDPTFGGTDIAVTSQPGVIIVLNGTVDTQAQVDAAISAAKAVPGVADVRSNLIIRGAAPVTVITPAPGAVITPAPGAATTTTTTSTTTPAP